MKENKITIITGGRRSGKTVKLVELIKDKKVCHVEDYRLNSSFCFSSLDKDTDVIVVYIHFYNKQIKNHLKALFSTTRLIVDRQMKKRFEVETPDIIITFSKGLNIKRIRKIITGNPDRYSIIKTVKKEVELYSGRYKTNEDLVELINKYTNKAEEFSISLGSYISKSGSNSIENIIIYKTQYKTESLTVI